MTARVLQIGDRLFELVSDSTLERDLYCSAWVRRGALDQVDIQFGVQDEENVRRLTVALEGSGVVLELVAALIAPRGIDWTAEVAAETRRYLAQLDGRTHRGWILEVLGPLIQMLFDVGALRYRA